MQGDMLRSRFFYGYGDVLGGRKTERCCSGYGCGDAKSRGFYDKLSEVWFTSISSHVLQNPERLNDFQT